MPATSARTARWHPPHYRLPPHRPGDRRCLRSRRASGCWRTSTLLYDELTAEENLVLFARLYGLDRPDERALAALEPAGLARRAQGSGAQVLARHAPAAGDRARDCWPIRRCCCSTSLPAGLDPAGQQWLGETLAHLADRGCTMLMSTHGASEAHAVVTRAVRLAGGTDCGRFRVLRRSAADARGGAGRRARGLSGAAFADRIRWRAVSADDRRGSAPVVATTGRSTLLRPAVRCWPRNCAPNFARANCWRPRSFSC